MPIPLDAAKLAAYRLKTFRYAPQDRLRTPQDAVEFVQARGFVFFWPITNTLLPSLWGAVAGDRPVPNNHDDPGHITWGWKDDLLGKGLWHYGRTIFKKNAIISPDLLPSFYALSPNYGDPETDFLDQYDQGLLTAEARDVYALLLRSGPLDSLTIRREAGLSSSSSSSRFNHALEILQMEFKIMPVGISTAGRWKYAFRYDLVIRHWPHLQDQARPLSILQARKNILTAYMQSVGAADPGQAARLLRWKPDALSQTANYMIEDGLLASDATLSNQQNQPILALTELVS